MDSNAINFIFNAERDDGGCLYRGCTKSFAYNFDPSANADDGSCLFNRASGKIATLGYMQNCLVHVDSNANLRIDSGEERNRAVPSDSIGYYSATYLTNANGNAGPVQAQRSAANGCVDSITGTPLSSPLRTHATASLTTPLTTLAMELLNPFAMIAPTSSLSNAAAVSSTICSNVLALSLIHI